MVGKEEWKQKINNGRFHKTFSRESISQDKLPKSYYVGQEYVEDPDKIDVFIKFKFRPAVVFSNINFDYSKLRVRQIERGEVLCTLEKTISQKLFTAISDPKDIHSLFRVTGFVLGYIKLYLPSINEHIQEQKYLDGHILARTISLNDIYGVLVANRAGDKTGVAAWPVPISGFPPSKLSPGQDAIFIRDMIDAMTAYFQYDLDECIRKVITSLENCFSHYKLSPSSTSKVNKIKRLIDEYVQEAHYPYIERDLKILRENILFIYHVRNLVVHDKLRISPSNTTVCRKAIGTLLYLYQGNFINIEQRTYIFSFYSQFITIFEGYSGYSLERAEWNIHEMKERNEHPPIINTPDDMNRFMFEGLQITTQEKEDILSGKREEHLPPWERVQSSTSKPNP